MSNPVNVLVKSPLDAIPILLVSDATASSVERCSPSRFNVQATTAEGWLLLWNTYTGNMNAFKPTQRDAVLELISRRGVASDASRLVAYLTDRGYLVPESADELRRVQHAFGKESHRTDKLELILLPSEDCNFRCTYCYEDFRRGTMLPEVREGIRNLVRARAKTLRELTVNWFGGEPLYGMEAIDELAPFFAGIAQENGISYFSHMTTNGFLLTDDVAQRLLAAEITDFQITLDGLAEDHDKMRPARDGSGTFETIYENLVSLSRRPEDYSVVIRVNFTSENAPKLEPLLEKLRVAFAGDNRFTLSFHSVGRWGGDNDADLAVCGRDEAQHYRMKLKSAARTLGLRVTSGWMPGAGVGSQVCYAARPYNFIVGAHGDLMKCTIDLDKRDRNIVGSLSRDGTLQLDQDKFALWTEPAFERDTGCQSCHMLPACQGIHCPQIRFDTGRRPCPGIRRTAKQEMVDFFEAKQVQQRSAVDLLPLPLPTYAGATPERELVDAAN
ncbi:hypothetical protein D3C71_473590 [compost metagenome]